MIVLRTGVSAFPPKKIHNFAEDHGETNVLKRESGEKPELCPQRYVLEHLAIGHCNRKGLREGARSVDESEDLPW